MNIHMIMASLSFPIWIRITHYITLLFATGEWTRLVAEIQFIAVSATCTHLDQVELEFA